ncbi:response regulator transcription factor [Bradyrhizobium betae]|uniref:helix-turn-helix transcriptional regulator n=1 Tax=Bradyrhizobium betae TaxID=244734 RepID=UPI003D67A311
MGSPVDIGTFSSFTMELHERSLSCNSISLFQWSVEALADIVGADCCWAGWADLQRGEVDLCASFSHNLPVDFEGFWSDIKHEDLLAHEVMTTKSTLAHYDRYGTRQTEGMAALSDRYHIEKMAVVVADQPDNPVSLFMSAYRSGRQTRAMDQSETDFIHGALDHVRYLAERSAFGGNSGTVSILANARGRMLAASPDTLRFVRDRWPGWDGQALPADIYAAPSLAGRRRLADLGVVIDRRELENRSGQSLFGITLRPINPSDRLTQRERQIADEIASGFTYKEIARRLALSPATVRNHTQAILGKLNIHSKAMLSRLMS